MSKTLFAAIALSVSGEYANGGTLGTTKSPLDFKAGNIFRTGEGVNQAEAAYADSRTLAASGTENLDLAGGLTDAFGAALGFTKVKALIIRAAAGNTNDVVVGGHASAAAATFFGDATDKVRVKPGGMFVLTAPNAAGYAITATTADLLTVANGGSGTPVSYDVIVIGSV